MEMGRVVAPLPYGQQGSIPCTSTILGNAWEAEESRQELYT